LLSCEDTDVEAVNLKILYHGRECGDGDEGDEESREDWEVGIVNFAGKATDGGT
jgi:hypothetical protein